MERSQTKFKTTATWDHFLIVAVLDDLRHFINLLRTGGAIFRTDFLSVIKQHTFSVVVFS